MPLQTAPATLAPRGLLFVRGGVRELPHKYLTKNITYFHIYIKFFLAMVDDVCIMGSDKGKKSAKNPTKQDEKGKNHEWLLRL